MSEWEKPNQILTRYQGDSPGVRPDSAAGNGAALGGSRGGRTGTMKLLPQRHSRACLGTSEALLPGNLREIGG